MLFGLHCIILVVFACGALGADFHLKHNWTAGTIYTPLARKIHDNLTNCTKQVNYHRQNNWGMGSDIHTWSQAVCNSMQLDSTLLQLEEDWIWNEKSYCPKGTKQPLGCYFNLQTHCPGSVRGGPRVISWKHDYSRCPKYIKDDKTRQEFRAAAMEFLFSNMSSRLVKEAESEIKTIFGEYGIPNDMITVHLRWGDKKLEMKLVSQEEFVEAIDQLARNYSISHPKVFITTESKHALSSMETYVKEHRKTWTLYNYPPSVFETRVYDKKTNTTNTHNPMAMARHTGGIIGKASLIALLLAMEAKYYILTSGSNWSRLIDELRRNVIDQECNFCTKMVDLREAFRDHNWRHL